MLDYIVNGQANGSVAGLLLNNNFDPNVLRPYCAIDPRTGQPGATYRTMWNTRTRRYEEVKISQPQITNSGLVINATTTLLKDEWIQLDTAIHKVARNRLGAVGALRSNGLQMIIPNGMAKTVLESQRQSDTTDAIVSMEPAVQGPSDRPEYDLVGVPLPIIHRDYDIGIRQLSISRNGGAPLDTANAEQATRKVSEMAEKMCLGSAGMAGAFGGYLLYGLTNFPQRNTRSLTNPAGVGWTPDQTVDDVIAMRQDAYNANHRGPYMLWVSPAWDQYLDVDYSAAKGDNTLRQRIEAIRGIDSVDTMDFLADTTMLLIQKDTNVVREIIGMDVTTMMWEGMGGLKLHFKVMAIMVCQPRADFDNRCGIVHGTV